MLTFYYIYLQQDAFYRTGKHVGLDLPYDEEIVVVKDAPQQEPGSVDCGAVVLYIVYKHVNHLQVLKNVADNELKTMRANIVNTLLLWGRDAVVSAHSRVRFDDGAGPSRM